MNQADNSILFPPGRIVQGDLYTPQDKDQQGNKLTIKTGPNQGKERVNYYFAYAIPKTPGVTHWGSEPGWGQKVWGLGHTMWPTLVDPKLGYITHPKFAWKIEDGDSTTPNENNRKNCDRDGHPGNWILKFGSMFPVKVFDAEGQPLLQKDLVKPGYWVEVWGSVESNNNQQKPGIHLNHNMVAYRAPGKEIVSGPDPRSVGFGRSSLPPGVSAAPAGGANFPAQTAPGAGAPPAPGGAPPAAGFAPPPPGGAPPPSPGYAAPGAPAGVPTAVQPNASFIAPPGGVNPPVAPAGVGAPPAPSHTAAPPTAYVDPLGAPAGYRMANPQGARYEAYRTNNWSDAEMIANGAMVRL